MQGAWGRDKIAHYVDSLHECQGLCLNSTTICYGIDYDAKDLKGNSQCHTLQTTRTIPDKTPGPGHVYIRFSTICLKVIGIRTVCFRLLVLIRPPDILVGVISCDAILSIFFYFALYSHNF